LPDYAPLLVGFAAARIVPDFWKRAIDAGARWTGPVGGGETSLFIAEKFGVI
jgi:hypothetical protein